MMDVDQDHAMAQAAQRQVRVQLMSKQEDIALPENTGPILVPTGENTNAFANRLILIYEIR